MNIKNKNILVSLFVMLLWGSLFPIVKIGFNAFDIVSTGDIMLFAGIRFLIGGFFIMLYCFIKMRKEFLAARKCLLLIFLAGLFAVILHYTFTYIGLTLIESSKTALLKKSGVLFYVLFAGLFFENDKLTLRKLFGVLLGFAGIIIINSDSLGITFNLGTILIICASFCTVFSNIVSKRIVQTVNPIVQTGISQFFGGAVLVALGLILGGKMTVEFKANELVFVYICLASIFSYCIWFNIVKKAELSRLFIIQFSEPVFATIFGALLLKENIFTWQFLLAFVLIFAGIFIANSKKK